MHSRLDPLQHTPEVIQQSSRLQQTIEAAGLDKKLGELLKIRASMINGCAFCINMHTRDARKMGETEARIYLLSVWRETTVFDARERAVLAWTDALTQLPERGAPQALYDDLTKHFSEKEITPLTSAIAMINYWNRIAVSFGRVHPSEHEER